VRDRNRRGRQARGAPLSAAMRAVAMRDERRGRASLAPADVLEIRRRHTAGERVVDLAEVFGCRSTNISKIVHFQRWKDVRCAS